MQERSLQGTQRAERALSRTPAFERRILLAAILFAAGVGGFGCESEPATTIPTEQPAPVAPSAPAPRPPPPEQGQVVFDPSPPVPEDVHWGWRGDFGVLLSENGSTKPIFAEVISTNPAVLEMRPTGSLWEWRAIGPGVATIEVRYEDRVVLSHDVRTPMPAHDNHHVMLRALLVPETWTSFQELGDGGWADGLPLRESPNLKYFEAAIWEGARAVHLYEFDNSFDPHLGVFEDISAEEYTAYRESFRVLAFPGLPLALPGENSSPELSRFLRETFEQIASYLVSRYPDSEHHLNYHGHGAAGGRLFEYQLFYDDAAEMLAHWTAELGRPLGVIDMGGPCNKSGYEDLTNFCRYARYYVASDMPQGNYQFDEWTHEKFQETHSELQYHRLFAESEDLRSVLVTRVDLNRTAFEYSRRDMVAHQWPQATYLHSCQDFEPFADDFIAFVNDREAPFEGGEDLLDYLETAGAGAGLLEGFRRVVIHGVDNRDFFAWSENRNGITMPRSWWWEGRYR